MTQYLTKSRVVGYGRDLLNELLSVGWCRGRDIIIIFLLNSDSSVHNEAATWNLENATRDDSDHSCLYAATHYQLHKYTFCKTYSSLWLSFLWKTPYENVFLLNRAKNLFNWNSGAIIIGCSPSMVFVRVWIHKFVFTMQML